MLRARRIVAVWVAVLAGCLMAGSVASARPASRAIPGARAPFAQPRALVRAAPRASQHTVYVYLKTRDQAGAEALARAVSNPRSRDYRHYLTAAQVRARFAPRPATVAAVRRWLRSVGLRPGTVPANRAYVEARGSIGRIESAFDVSLGFYRFHGHALLAADRAPLVPLALASSVLQVAGLNEIPATADDASPAPPAGFRNAQPCNSYWDEQFDTTDPPFDGQQLPYAPCGYTPSQVRSAYGVDTLLDHGIDGIGQKVATVLWFGSPNEESDVMEYALRNDPGNAWIPDQYTEQLDTPFNDDPSCGNPYSEQALDVEAIHAMAPGADVQYVGATDCYDASLEAAENSIVSADSVNIISNSWGGCSNLDGAGAAQAYDQIFMQAAMEGIGVYFSSGDSGDGASNCGSAQPQDPAASPWVTAVGGTSDGIDASGHRVFETGWETGKSLLQSDGTWSAPAFVYGSGGGTSAFDPEPKYQDALVPPALTAANQTGGGAGRVVPDMAALADPTTGFLIGVTQTFPDGTYYDQFREGGTSVAAPLVAGMMADANSLDGVNHGFVNPALYGVAKPEGGLQDVLPASGGAVRVDYANNVSPAGGYLTTVRTFDDESGLAIHDTAGYNDVTGLGSPNGPVLFSVHSLSLTPPSSVVQPGASVPYTATGVDGLGAKFDATDASSFSISPSGGTTGAQCTGNSCSATAPGSYTVTATYTGTAPTLNGQTLTATATLTVPGPPTATITTPRDGATYGRGQVVDAAYSCADGTGGPGLASGSTGCSGTVPNGSPVDTSTLGTHAFTVTATSSDGLSSTTTVHYTVVGCSACADVSAAISGPSSAADGSTFTETVTVADAGPATARNVTAAVLVPSGLTVTNTGGGRRQGGAVYWTARSIAAGGSVTYTVTLRVSRTASGTANIPAIAASTQVRDPNYANNVATTSVTLGSGSGTGASARARAQARSHALARARRSFGAAVTRLEHHRLRAGDL